MTSRPLVAAFAACTLLASPGYAKHRKPISESYDLLLPVPYAADGASHCTDGVEDMSQDHHPVTLPDRGRLDIELSGFLGDWVLELFDSKGRMLAQAALLDPADTDPVRKLSYKKGTKGQRVTIAACNVTGGPRGAVRWTFTFL